MLKQNRITLKEAHKGQAIFHDIPLRCVRVDYAQVLTIAHTLTCAKLPGATR